MEAYFNNGLRIPLFVPAQLYFYNYLFKGHPQYLLFAFVWRSSKIIFLVILSVNYLSIYNLCDVFVHVKNWPLDCKLEFLVKIGRI